MDFYRELEAYKKLNNQIYQMNSFIRQLTSQSQNTPGGNVHQQKIQQLETTVETLMALRNKLNMLYRPYKNDPKRFKTMTEADVAELKNYYEISADMVKGCLETLYPDEKTRNSKVARYIANSEAMLRQDYRLVEKFRAENGLSLPAAAFKAHSETISDPKNNKNAEYKWPGFFEYESLFLADPTVSHEDALRMYNRKSAEEIRQEYEQKVKSDPHFYEYPRSRNRIDPKIRNTGNVEKINQYLAADEQKENEADKLTFREKQMLIHHREATKKVNEIQASVEPKMQAGKSLGKKPKFLRNEEGAVELDVHLPTFQSSSNGCWSCAGAMLAQSRGIAQVTQEDIRNYRPDIGENENVPDRGDVDDNYNYDGVKSLMENADSVLQHAPNSMLRTLTVTGYSDDYRKDYTRSQYIHNTEKLLKKQIMHALRVDKSPVSFLRPNHYITIVGMEGNDVLFKDSNNFEGRTEPADHTYRVKLRTLITSNFNYIPGPAPIEIGWLSDIKLSKDHKTIHGVPSEYVYMNEDGTVTQQPLAMRESMGIFDNGLNRTGVLVTRPAEDEDQVLSADRGIKYSSAGVQMTEQVYLPKKLNADYLKKRADKRNQAYEEGLNKADRDFYHIKEGKKDPEQAEAEFRRRMNLIANEKKAEPEPEIPEKNEREDEIDTTSVEVRQKQREEQAKKKPLNPRNTDRDKRLIKEKKLIARKERLRAEELREKYTFPKITGAAGDLLTKMNQHKHFYLALANPAYKNVIGHLEKIRLLSQKAISQNAEDPFTDEDAKKLVRAIDLGAKEAKKYLSDKQEEMERDPRRKNDPGKMKNEQPRIDAMLDCYEVLSEMALSLRARENTKDIITLDEERNVTVNQFSDELTSNLSDPRGAQKDSGENRLYIPAHKAADLERLESHFGFVVSKKKKLRIVNADNDMVSDIGVYPAIGAVDEADHLSKKDFAALAIAASTTPEAMKDEYKVADPSGSFTAEDNLAYHRGDLLHRVVRAKQEDLESIRPDIQKSKGIVSKALLDYEQGNIDPLGKLIADGIKNLNDLYAGGRYAGDKETELYMAEMGLRMKGMLERDQRLMEKAMTYGVTPKMLKDLMNQGIAAQNGVLAARWSSEEYLAKGENWGIREKERNYVDLLVNRYLEEEREKAVPKAKVAVESKEAQYSRQLKTPKSTPYMDKISDVGNERELRDRFRAYIRENGYMDYTPKEFLDEIVGSKEKPAVGRNASLMVELGAFEASQKAKKSAPLEVSRNLVFSEKTRNAAAPGKTKQGATVKKVQKPVLG